MARFLVAIDYHLPSAYVVDACRSLVSADDEVLVVAVVPPWATAVAHRHPVIGGLVSTLEAETRRCREDEAWAQVHNAGAQLCDSGARVEMHVLRGHDPAQVILDMARQRDADAIVIGACRRRGLARLFCHRVASRLLSRASCLVVVSHPRDPDPVTESDLTTISGGISVEL